MKKKRPRLKRVTKVVAAKVVRIERIGGAIYEGEHVVSMEGVTEEGRPFILAITLQNARGVHDGIAEIIASMDGERN